MSLFSYVGFASSIASLGYSLEESEAHLLEVEEGQNDLIIELANIQTPTTLAEYTAVLDLVETDQISGYIDTREGDLGLKNR